MKPVKLINFDICYLTVFMSVLSLSHCLYPEFLLFSSWPFLGKLLNLSELEFPKEVGRVIVHITYAIVRIKILK